ncbi:hypothetical protein GTY77_27185 [Streptomyces sp. SID8380]|nr:hypothetical protein [Streptomyces sp. SID8380]
MRDGSGVVDPSRDGAPDGFGTGRFRAWPGWPPARAGRAAARTGDPPRRR